MLTCWHATASFYSLTVDHLRDCKIVMKHSFSHWSVHELPLQLHLPRGNVMCECDVAYAFGHDWSKIWMLKYYWTRVCRQLRTLQPHQWASCLRSIPTLFFATKFFWRSFWGQAFSAAAPPNFCQICDLLPGLSLCNDLVCAMWFGKNISNFHWLFLKNF